MQPLLSSFPRQCMQQNKWKFHRFRHRQDHWLTPHLFVSVVEVLNSIKLHWMCNIICLFCENFVVRHCFLLLKSFFLFDCHLQCAWTSISPRNCVFKDLQWRHLLSIRVNFGTPSPGRKQVNEMKWKNLRKCVNYVSLSKLESGCVVDGLKVN